MQGERGILIPKKKFFSAGATASAFLRSYITRDGKEPLPIPQFLTHPSSPDVYRKVVVVPLHSIEG